MNFDKSLSIHQSLKFKPAKRQNEIKAQWPLSAVFVLYFFVSSLAVFSDDEQPISPVVEETQSTLTIIPSDKPASYLEQRYQKAKPKPKARVASKTKKKKISTNKNKSNKRLKPSHKGQSKKKNVRKTPYKKKVSKPR